METQAQRPALLSFAFVPAIAGTLLAVAGILILRGGDSAAGAGLLFTQGAILYGATQGTAALAERYKLRTWLQMGLYMLAWLPLAGGAIYYRSLADHSDEAQAKLQGLAALPARAKAELDALHEPMPWPYQILGMDAQVRRLELIAQVGPPLQDGLPDIDNAGDTASACLDQLARPNFLLRAWAYHAEPCVDSPAYNSKALTFPSDEALLAYDAAALKLGLLMNDMMPLADSTKDQAVLVHAFHLALAVFLATPIDAAAVAKAPAALEQLKAQWTAAAAPSPSR